jgi:hypothetical protein
LVKTHPPVCTMKNEAYSSTLPVMEPSITVAPHIYYFQPYKITKPHKLYTMKPYIHQPFIPSPFEEKKMEFTTKYDTIIPKKTLFESSNHFSSNFNRKLIFRTQPFKEENGAKKNMNNFFWGTKNMKRIGS